MSDTPAFKTVTITATCACGVTWTTRTVSVHNDQTIRMDGCPLCQPADPTPRGSGDFFGDAHPPTADPTPQTEDDG